MAEKIKASDLIDKDVLAILEQVNKSIKNITKSTADLMAVTKQNDEAFKKGVTTQKELTRNQEAVNKTTKQMTDLEKENIRIQNEYNKALAKQASLNDANYQKKVRDLEQLKKDNKEREKEVKGIKETSDAEAKRRANIGKYKEDIVKAYVAINAVLLVAKAAYNAVNNAIKENETTSEFLERKIGGLSAAFGVLKSYVYSAAESLISSNDKSINWGNGLRNVLSAITMGFSELIPGIRRTGEEMNQASKEAEKLVKAQQDLADLEGDRILKRSESNRQLVEARDLYNDETKSLTEKRNLLKSAIDLEKQQLDEEIAYQFNVKENLIAQGELKKKLKTFDVGREGLAIKQAEAKLNDLVTESLTRQRKAKANLRAIDKQISDEAIGKFSDISGNTWKASLDEWGKEWDKSTEDIEKKGQDSLKQMNDDINKYNEEKVKSEKETQDKIDKADEDRHNKHLKRIELEKQLEDEIRSMKIASANAVFDIASGFMSREIQGLEEKKQKEIYGAGDNAKKKERIEAEYNKKIGAIKRRQAIAEKVNGVFNVGINTAIAIMKNNAQLGTVLAAPINAWTRVLAALQIAAIMAQPIPKFFKGVRGFKGGLATVGDPNGQTEDSFELVETPKGSFLTPNKATEMLLPKGTNVYSHKETVEKLNNMHPSVANELIKEQRLTRKALANQQHNSTVINERGARFLTQYGSSTTEWINKNFR